MRVNDLKNKNTEINEAVTKEEKSFCLRLITVIPKYTTITQI